MRLNDLKIKTRLLGGYGITIILFVVVTIGVYININSIGTSYKKVTDIEATIAKINSLNKIMSDIESGERGFLLTGSENFLEPYSNGISNYNQTFNSLRQDVINEPEQLALLDNIKNLNDNWVSLAEGLMEMRRSIDRGTLNSEALTSEVKKAKSKATMVSIHSAIDRFINNETVKSNEYKADAESTESFAITFTIISAVIAVILSLFAGVYISNGIAGPLARGLVMMKDLGNGILSTRTKFNTKDELGLLGEAMDSFADTLQAFVGLMYNVAAGDLSVTAPPTDPRDEIAPALNKIVFTLRDLREETSMLSGSALEGKLNARGNMNKFTGAYNEIVKGINDTLDAVIAPINEGVHALQKIAHGDMTVSISSSYKGDHQLIKDSINEVTRSLNKALNEVNEAIQAASSSSTEISSSTEQMAAGAEEQSSQTGEVATAIEQMTKTIVETTRNASAAAENSKHAGEIAREGGNAVNDTIKGMQRISDVVMTSADTVKKLGKSSDQIGEIVQVIDDIADQTNLLALNAAIEAARAGEQGRGFAVVADEVRKLAERTTKATKEIAEMIKQIQKDTTEAVVSMATGTEEVDKGKKLAEHAGESLREIIDATVKVVDDINQVASASEEQSSSAEQISKNIEMINNVTAETASGIHQVAKTAEDLNRLTTNLQNLITRFKITSDNNLSEFAVRSNGKLVNI
jgi:methyl-accepting chemotaxis protein